MKFSKLVFPGIAMIATTYGLGRFSFGLFLPEVTNDLHLTASQSGVISSLFYLAYCFTIIYSTLQTDKIGPKRMIMLAGFSVLIGLVGIGFSPNAIILSIGVIFAGASTGLISPPYGYTISLWIKVHEQGKANTWINSGTSIGLMFTGITAMFAFIDWRQTYFVYAILALAVLIWNYLIIPSLKEDINIHTGSFNIRDISASTRIVITSTLLGISTATFWTFSKSFVQNTGNYSDFALSIFWILIGLFGMIGGISGAIIDKRGLHYAFNLGVIALAIATIALAFTPNIWLIPFVSASLFGMSYIFLTGVLLVWGIKIFVKNASLGIGIPFLMLAVGQVIGASLAGLLIDAFNFMYTFIIYGVIGFIPLFIYPKVKLEENQLPKGDYSQLQHQNPEIINHEHVEDSETHHTDHQYY
ncbi:MFS transporter [Staphylococcus nepalensis]|uniref:MFS transporter n=1 Tax=Staphylococcus nepalensis TaxID=214473 RepID=A0ABS3KYI4_9STAP|nr:MFS transporter [Staphylococcus nepalensis]MBO1212468.1 MFS transporter [Staphylococcus nepalensis]MBO1216088.1 MFS transporter [Staphylococcus nepalensis]MBO1226355.1 MFS transporter [Staphylococcus nepalensis]MBO1235157.1 MFS transporter [Staphylococcus nepalensis]MBO1236136.1 MFS transporter [Staphylococcus nepalensis]